MKSYKFIVMGKVQGVYYRKSVHEKASKLQCSGYVKNLLDLTVEAVVTCEESRIEEFIKILEEGSENSRVDKIQQIEIDEVFNGSFEISY